MKKSLFFITLIGLFACLCSQRIFPLTTGLSCLYDPQTGKKVAILYDIHLVQLIYMSDLPEDATKESSNLLKQQKNDLKNLVASLEKKDQESLFLGECPSFILKDPSVAGEIRKGTLMVVPELFIETGSDKIGNLTFTAADPREEITFAAAELICRVTEFKKYLEEEVSLIEIYAKMTIDFYIDYLKGVIHNLLQKLDSISLDSFTVNILKERLNSLSKKIDLYVEFALKEYNLKKSDHLTYLYEKELQLNKAWLINNAEKVEFLRFDIEFLSLVKNTSVKNIIIQAGGLHSKFITHFLQKKGYNLINEFGNTNDLIVDEHKGEVVPNYEPSIMNDPFNLETIQAFQKKALNNVGQLIFNFFKDHSEEEIN